MDIKSAWKRYKKSKLNQDRDVLIEYYLEFTKLLVGKIASNLPNHIKMKDLFSSGVAGLVRAIEKFNPEKKCRFESYATIVIKGAVLDELRQLDWVPRSIHRKSSSLYRVQEKLQYHLGRDPTQEELAKEMEISLDELQETFEQIRPVKFVYLNESVAHGEDEVLVAEKIPDKNVKMSSQIVDQKHFSHVLKQSIEFLNPKEQSVITCYYFEEMLLKEIGRKLGISESRVCQIHASALEKLKKRLLNFK